MGLRFIPIDRGDRSTARQSFASAIARLRRDLHPLFPRDPVHDRHLLRSSAAASSWHQDGLPSCLWGCAARAVQPKGSVTIRPGKVEVGYGAPISGAEYGIRRRAELTSEVRRRVAELAGLALPEGES